MPTQADRIRAARDSRGWTQQELAAAMSEHSGKKITRGAVGNWERGEGIKREHLKTLSQVTGYRAEYIEEGKLPKLISEAAGIPSADLTAGRRLAAIRAVMCSDLPALLGIANEAVWEALISRPGTLDARIAQQVAEETGLPLGYVQDGDLSELSREQALALLEFHSTRP